MISQPSLSYLTDSVFNRCAAGQRVFAYVNGTGIVAVGHIVDGQVVPDNTVFDQCREYRVKVEWETTVADDNGITLREIKEKFGYGLPVRHTFCNMSRPDIADWIAKKLLRRAGNSP